MRLFKAPDVYDVYDTRPNDYDAYDNYPSEYRSSDFTTKQKKSPQKINPPKIILTEPANGKIDELTYSIFVLECLITIL